MDNKTFRVFEKCRSCNGTGLFIGMAEREGAAVVCSECKGSGCFEFIHQYENFVRKANPPIGIKRVFECNPGIIINANPEFGGMPIKEWEAGYPFPRNSENRKSTCPAWWYQSCDYKKKPDWNECILLGVTFSSCKNFIKKSVCWERWDKEQSGRRGGRP